MPPQTPQLRRGFSPRYTRRKIGLSRKLLDTALLCTTVQKIRKKECALAEENDELTDGQTDGRKTVIL